MAIPPGSALVSPPLMLLFTQTFMQGPATCGGANKQCTIVCEFPCTGILALQPRSTNKHRASQSIAHITVHGVKCENSHELSG